MCFFFFKQKTAYEMRISDWSSDVCSSDLLSANPESVRGALEHGVAAATILPAKAPAHRHDQLRIAFDGAAVIFNDESERVSQEGGIEAFHRHARARAREPLPGGPIRGIPTPLHPLSAADPPEPGQGAGRGR